jgi:hypothetical protein
VVTGILIPTTGSGYSDTPLIRMPAPPFHPDLQKLAIDVSWVNVKILMLQAAPPVLKAKPQLQLTSSQAE